MHTKLFVFLLYFCLSFSVDFVSVTPEQLDESKIRSYVSDNTAGAISIFIGRIEWFDYTVYSPSLSLFLSLFSFSLLSLLLKGLHGIISMVILLVTLKIALLCI